MSDPEITQAKPTQPRPVDEQGHELDEWGLPLSGPVRKARLAEIGKPDPNDDPKAWEPAAKRGRPSQPEGQEKDETHG